MAKSKRSLFPTTARRMKQKRPRVCAYSLFCCCRFFFFYFEMSRDRFALQTKEWQIIGHRSFKAYAICDIQKRIIYILFMHRLAHTHTRMPSFSSPFTSQTMANGLFVSCILLFSPRFGKSSSSINRKYIETKWP